MTKFFYISKIHLNQSINYLLTKEKKKRIKKLKNPKPFIDYSQIIDNVYENLGDYKPTKKRRVFDNMIADIESNKKLSPTLFLRGRKLVISLVFVSQSYFKVPKTIRLNATYYFIMKIPNNK